MSNQRRQAVEVVQCFFAVFVIFAVFVSSVIYLRNVGFVSFVIFGVAALLILPFLCLGLFSGVKGAVSLRRRRRCLRSPEDLRAVSSRSARSLRWVSCLLPGDEGADWWAEVTSCLAEAHEPGERRQYIRSYRRGVPQLIWTSWTTQLSASRRRTLS